MAAPPRGESDPGNAARRDRGHIYVAKTIRAVAYGALSVFLVVYLAQDLGFSALSSIVLTSLTLAGAAAWNLLALPWLEARIGRRRTLLLFGGLFTLSAAMLYLTANPALVIVAILIGGVAASTADNGPLASLDQAILPSTASLAARATVFSRYNLAANFASAGGALLVTLPGALDLRYVPFLPPAPHPYIIVIYFVLAAASWVAYVGLSPAVEVQIVPGAARRSALSPATRTHLGALSALFGVDAFAGGMVINPLIAVYFFAVWNQSVQSISLILFAAGTVAGLSFLLSSYFASRIGLLRTMVFTHLPSNVLLVLVPFMPTFGSALGVLLARFALSQMDVPTRQAYAMELVGPEERTQVAGTLAGARSVAQALGPFPAVALQAAGLFGGPFVVAGTLKVAYDLVLWRRFRRIELPSPAPALPDESPRSPTSGAFPPRGG